MNITKWVDSALSGDDKDAAAMVDRENRDAISWFESQRFPPIPSFAGESGAAEYCFDMASMAQNSGIVKEAWAGFHQALYRYLKLDDKKMAGLTCFNLGKVYGVQSNWGMARAMFRQSAFLAKAVGDRKGYAWSLFYLGDACDRLGDKGLCRKHWQESHQEFLEVSPSDARNVKGALEKLDL